MKASRSLLLAASLFGIAASASAGWVYEIGGKRYGSPDAACRARIPKDASYAHSHTKKAPDRDDLYECYVKAKEGDFVAFWGHAVEDNDEPVKQDKKSESASASDSQTSSSASESKKEQKANCNYEFKQSANALGGDQLSNLLCAQASDNSPSFSVYPKGKDGKLGKMLTEVDALRGNTWYECKCGYLSTVQGAKKGNKAALLSLEGPTGIDKKLRTQSQVASECGYDFRIVVANPTVAEFFRERYTFATVEQVDFQPCE